MILDIFDICAAPTAYVLSCGINNHHETLICVASNMSPAGGVQGVD